MEAVTARLRALVRRGTAERELDAEIRFHLEQEAAAHVRAGASEAEAWRRAQAAFGGVTQTREAHRAVRGLPWLEQAGGDARHALRILRRSPVLAGAAILTLALGVGANTAIFSAVNAVILQPLPFPAPQRLFMLWEENPEKGWHRQVAAPANVLDWREQVKAFEDVAAYNSGGTQTLAADGRSAPRLVHPAEVTGNFFSTLGVHAEIGRTLRDDETWENQAPVVVIGWQLWQDRFGGAASVLGRTIRIDGKPLQIVGVMPEGFAFPDEKAELWRPMAWKQADRGQTWFRRGHWLRVIARLRPAATPQVANTQLQAVVQRLKHQYPETNRVMGAGMTPLHDFLVGDTRLPLLVLLGGAALLLLIACANVGNLLLVHASGREREAALRLALGAGHGRLVRQALTESLVLSTLGGGAGLLLGLWGTRALQALQPVGMLRVAQFGIDGTVLAFVLGLAMASGLVFGTAPALWARHRLPAEALKTGGRVGSQGRGVRRWGEHLVIGEVALALLLSLGAGLLVRSFLQLRRVDPGFDPRGVLSATVNLPDTRYDTPAKAALFFDELLRRVRALPGVNEAAAVTGLPLTQTSWTSDFTVVGRPAGWYGTEVVHRTATPGYFKLMRIPLLRGRAFADADRHGAPPVVVINEAMARQHFRGEDPIGQRIAFDKVPDSTTVWSTIVGVVGSEHQSTLATDPQIEVYAPFAQDRPSYLNVVARAAGDPAVLGPAVRRTVAEMDPELVLTSLRTMDDVRAVSLAPERFITTLLTLFAAVGLALAVIGVYGVMAQLARRRTRELGIRLALGAQSSEVRWMVVRHGLRLVILGLVLGGAGALLTTRTLSALLFHVAPNDPLTFLAAAAMLALTGVLATWLPALQASRADPASALRSE